MVSSSLRVRTVAIAVVVSSILTSPTSVEAFTNVQPPNNCHPRERRLSIPSKLEVEPAIIGGAIVAAGAAAFWLSGADNREKQSKYAEYEAQNQAYQEERERLAYIEPKEAWREDELRPYDGTAADETGPILLAVKGDVFNVWKGRGFYGPGAEYRIMAGRDATRFLAKNRLEEESDEQRKVGLNLAERANLEAWYWTIKNKYPRVGGLEGYDAKSTEM